MVQLSIGTTLFGSFREAASQLEVLGSVTGAIVACSFMGYDTDSYLKGTYLPEPSVDYTFDTQKVNFFAHPLEQKFLVTSKSRIFCSA